MEMEMKMLGRWKRRGDKELECVVRKRERERCGLTIDLVI